MRILVFSQYFWPENFRINDIAISLCKKGHQVEVLTGKPNYPRGEIFQGYKQLGCQLELHEGIMVHRIPLFARGRGGMRLLLNYLSFIFFGLVLAPWVLVNRKADVIFVYGLSPILQALPAIMIGWLKGIPVVLWVQDLWPESLSATGYIKNTVVLKLVEYIVKYIYQRVDLLLVQSQAFVAPVEALASGTPVIHYPNSVDESFSLPTTADVPDLNGLLHGFSIMFAGNIGSAQAVEVIIEAAMLLREYTDIHFVVLGDGSRHDWMLKEAKQRGLSNVHLPGRFPIETMPGFMRKASALLVTLSDENIFAATVPNKIQAYMAIGKPIIACLNGEGARLVIEAESGLAVPAEDAESLSDAVLKLYKMPLQERERLGDNGRRYYNKKFDHDKLVSELINHFETVVQKKEGSI